MMIPRIPSSPTTARHYRSFSRPPSTQTSPTRSIPSHFSPREAFMHQHGQSCGAGFDVELGPQSDSCSVESGLGDSCSMRSPPASGSRNSSVSHNSANSAAWGCPLPTSPTQAKPVSKQTFHRKTRRFESGSTQLKPLLLSAMATESSVPQLPPPVPLFASPSRREISEQSIDPTISFLSQPFGLASPDEGFIAAWSSEDALRALEGGSSPRLESFEDILAQHEAIMAGNVPSPRSIRVHDRPQEDERRGRSWPSLVHDDIDKEETTTVSETNRYQAQIDSMPSLVGGAAEMVTEAGEDVQRDAERTIPTRRPSPPGAIVQIAEPVTKRHGQPLLQRYSATTAEHLPQPLSQPSVPISAPARISLHFQDGYFSSTLTEPEDSPNSGDFQRCDKSTGGESESRSPARRSSLAVTEQGSASDHVPNPCSVGIRTSNKDPRLKSKVKIPSSLEMFQRKATTPMPLTSVTIRTIFGTLSRFTSYMREVRRDPTALARRVIANAWFSHWKRLGKLSWWVLGLFLGPGVRPPRAMDLQCTTWDWEHYDAEAIAGTACQCESFAPAEEAVSLPAEARDASPSSQGRKVQFDSHHEGYRTAGTKSPAKRALRDRGSEQHRKRPGWGESLYLWGKFSVAIMLAVGGALIEGPGAMLKDCEEPRGHRPSKTRSARTRRTAELVDGVDRPDHPGDAGAENQNAPHEGGGIPEVSLADARTSPLKTSEQAPISNVAAERMYTFGSPSGDAGWDEFDDDGKSKPTMSRDFSHSGIDGFRPSFGDESLYDELEPYAWSASLEPG